MAVKALVPRFIKSSNPQIRDQNATHCGAYPSVNFRRLAGTLFGETPNTTREDAYAPQTLGLL